MDNKKLLSAVQHFDKIKPEIISDAVIVTSEKGAVVYARVIDIDDKYGSAIIVAGDIQPVAYALAHIIIKLARKSELPISAISRIINEIAIDLEKEV